MEKGKIDSLPSAFLGLKRNYILEYSKRFYHINYLYSKGKEVYVQVPKSDLINIRKKKIFLKCRNRSAVFC